MSHARTHTHTVLTAMFHVHRGSLLVPDFCCPGRVHFVNFREIFWPTVFCAIPTIDVPLSKSIYLWIIIVQRMIRNISWSWDLIIKLTGVNPSDSLTSAVFFFLRVHLSALIWSCSTSLASSHCCVSQSHIDKEKVAMALVYQTARQTPCVNLCFARPSLLTSTTTAAGDDESAQRAASRQTCCKQRWTLSETNLRPN